MEWNIMLSEFLNSLYFLNCFSPPANYQIIFLSSEERATGMDCGGAQIDMEKGNKICNTKNC